jgi:DNA-binding YbaB/EbfC family protein
MFGSMDFSKLGEQMQQMQEQLKKQQEEQLNQEFSIKSSGGLIVIKAKGSGEIIDLEIDPSLMDDRESMQLMLMGAINELYTTLEKNRQNSLLKSMGSWGGFGS